LFFKTCVKVKLRFREVYEKFVLFLKLFNVFVLYKFVPVRWGWDGSTDGLDSHSVGVRFPAAPPLIGIKKAPRKGELLIEIIHRWS
jgi:hypothetical protein